MQLQLVIYSGPKEGYSPAEWEDGAAGGTFRSERGGDPSIVRFAVADGATETYESRRWVDMLISSFLSTDPAGGPGWPELEHGSMVAWFKAMQAQWWAAAPTTLDYMEQLKIRQGTLSTFVGGQILNLHTGVPVWQAVALGDSVLFHVRNGKLFKHFPPLRSSDFDSAPDGITTRPEGLGRMGQQLKLCGGSLEPDDIIFVATDALAKWIITCHETGDQEVWPLLGDLVHPRTFNKIVSALRVAGAMKDDDVTLMRIRPLVEPVSTVVVCL